MKNLKIPLIITSVVFSCFLCLSIYWLFSNIINSNKDYTFESSSLKETKLFSVDLPFTYGSNNNYPDLRFILLSPNKKYLFYHSPSCLPNGGACGSYIIDLHQQNSVLLEDSLSTSFGWLDDNTIFIGLKEESKEFASGSSYTIDSLDSIVKEDKQDILIDNIKIYKKDYIKSNFQISGEQPSGKDNNKIINSKDKTCSDDLASCFVLTQWANCFLECTTTHEQVDIFIDGKNIDNYKVKPPLYYATRNTYGDAWIMKDELLFARVEKIYNAKQIITLGIYKLSPK